MNRFAAFLLILALVGVFVWFQRDRSGSGTPLDFDSPAAATSVPGENYIIQRKVKPGGYIGWHTSEIDPFTQRAKHTRQASNYYFVCVGATSGAERTFLVPRSTFLIERVGNVLSPSAVSAFQEVAIMEEPPLPSSFEFRRREKPERDAGQ